MDETTDPLARQLALPALTSEQFKLGLDPAAVPFFPRPTPGE